MIFLLFFSSSLSSLLILSERTSGVSPVIFYTFPNSTNIFKFATKGAILRVVKNTPLVLKGYFSSVVQIQSLEGLGGFLKTIPRTDNSLNSSGWLTSCPQCLILPARAHPLTYSNVRHFRGILKHEHRMSFVREAAPFCQF